MHDILQALKLKGSQTLGLGSRYVKLSSYFSNDQLQFVLILISVHSRMHGIEIENGRDGDRTEIEVGTNETVCHTARLLTTVYTLQFTLL